MESDNSFNQPGVKADKKANPRAVTAYLLERKLFKVFKDELNHVTCETVAAEIQIDLFEMEELTEGTSYQLTDKQLEKALGIHKKKGLISLFKYLNEIRKEIIKLERDEYED